MTKKSTRFFMRIEPEMLARWQAEAKARGVSTAALVMEAMECGRDAEREASHENFK